jgi:hypothetical protein
VHYSFEKYGFAFITIAPFLRRVDLRQEGIFRKNGNIRNLNVLQDKLDRDPWNGAPLRNESPIQVAALLKKFLREMPEPLLTFKLYKLFLLSQSTFDDAAKMTLMLAELPNVEHRKRMLHCIVCLLPKPNRDSLEVLMNFLREVARYASCEDGNKMDANNLATVIAPNILYAKNQQTPRTQDRVSVKDESMLSISAVKSLMEHQDRFWTVRLTAFVEDADLFRCQKTLPKF